MVLGRGATRGRTLLSLELTVFSYQQSFSPAFLLFVERFSLGPYLIIFLSVLILKASSGALSLSDLITVGSKLTVFELVEKVWSSSGSRGTATFKLARKLKCLKEEIKKWAITAGRFEELKITSIMIDIDIFDKVGSLGSQLKIGRKGSN